MLGHARSSEESRRHMSLSVPSSTCRQGATGTCSGGTFVGPSTGTLSSGDMQESMERSRVSTGIRLSTMHG